MVHKCDRQTDHPIGQYTLTDRDGQTDRQTNTEKDKATVRQVG